MADTIRKITLAGGKVRYRFVVDVGRDGEWGERALSSDFLAAPHLMPVESANILNNSTERSLVILDEVGRGTSTYDGLAIAWAMVEHLARVRAKVLFATHYHQLNALAEQVQGVACFTFREPHVSALAPRAVCDGCEVALELLQDAIALEIELELGEDEIA